MPFTSKRSQYMMGKTNAKTHKQGPGTASRSSSAPEPMHVEPGEPMRTAVPIRPDPALCADVMPAPRHRAAGIDASDGFPRTDR